MRILLILTVALMILAVSGVRATAASYQQTDGTIVDPIQSVLGGNHPYSGIDLLPAANPRFANLDYADLERVDLDGSDLIGVSLIGADLRGANLNSTRMDETNLSDADLTGATMIFSSLHLADLAGVNLTDANLFGVRFDSAILNGADFSGADLSRAIFLGTTTGIPYYDSLTIFTRASAGSSGGNFDPVAAGWTLVPEPSTALLMGFGLAGLAAKRRRA